MQFLAFKICHQLWPLSGRINELLHVNGLFCFNVFPFRFLKIKTFSLNIQLKLSPQLFPIQGIVCRPSVTLIVTPCFPQIILFQGVKPTMTTRFEVHSMNIFFKKIVSFLHPYGNLFSLRFKTEHV